MNQIYFLVLKFLYFQFIIERNGIFALDMIGSKEQSCFPVTQTYVDLDWLTKPTFYNPMSSRYHLYSIVAQLLTPIPPSQIIEGSVYYDSCIRFKLSPDSTKISGYEGNYGWGQKETNYFNEPGPGWGTSFKPMGGNGLNGTFWITKTDNKTYAVVSLCAGDDEMMWSVMSTSPELPSKNKDEIVDHLIKIGFKEEYFTELRYYNCNE